jgi:hypothetical protein
MFICVKLLMFMKSQPTKLSVWSWSCSTIVGCICIYSRLIVLVGAEPPIQHYPRVPVCLCMRERERALARNNSIGGFLSYFLESGQSGAFHGKQLISYCCFCHFLLLSPYHIKFRQHWISLHKIKARGCLAPEILDFPP